MPQRCIDPPADGVGIALVHADLRAGACRRWDSALDTPHADRLAKARRRVTHMPALDRETVAKLIAAAPPPVAGRAGGRGMDRLPDRLRRLGPLRGGIIPAA